jgi:hypothetical protein
MSTILNVENEESDKYVAKVLSFVDVVDLHKIKVNVNSFFFYFMNKVGDKLHFPDIVTEMHLTLSPCAFLRSLRNHFIEKLRLILWYIIPSPENRAALFKKLMDCDFLLRNMVEQLSLNTLELFVPGDVMADSMHINLLLCFLNAIDFDETMLVKSIIVAVETPLQTAPGVLTGVGEKMSVPDDKKIERSFKENVLSIVRGEKNSYPMNEIRNCFEEKCSGKFGYLTHQQVLDKVGQHHQKNILDYYYQFLGPILDEVRANAAQGVDEIGKLRNATPVSKMRATVQSEEQIENNSHYQMPSIKCTVIGKLPDTEHFLAYEVVRLLVNKTFMFAIADKFESERVSVVAGVKEVIPPSCVLTFLAGDAQMFYQHFEFAEHFEVHFLCGLIGFSRMFDVCKTCPRGPIIHQLVHATLPKWSEPNLLTASLAHSLHSRLNPVQAEVVAGFIFVLAGLYLMEGPPGTGNLQ